MARALNSRHRIYARNGSWVCAADPGDFRRERARTQLQEDTLSQLARARNPEAKAAVIAGEPADVVSRYAKEVDADVIVTGSHQRGFWGALLTGGGAREVVREAPCAVFLVTKPFAEKVSAASRL